MTTPTKAEYKAMYDNALGSAHHVTHEPYSMPAANPFAILIVGLGAVTGAAILLYAIFQLF